MRLELQPDEVQLVREVLSAYVRDLSHEIADTDNARFRATLRGRREALAAVLDRLGGTVPTEG